LCVFFAYAEVNLNSTNEKKEENDVSNAFALPTGSGGLLCTIISHKGVAGDE
jgi:hypothetical protein